MVTAPDYAGAGALPEIELAWNAASNRYEGAYGGFLAAGEYVCTFRAMDNAGGESSPIQALVTASGANEPDAYEPDDDAASATWFAVNETQLHSFHRSNDVDWVRFYVPQGAVCEIEAEPVFGNVDLRMDVWRQRPDGSWTNMEWLTADEEGAGTVAEATWIDERTDPTLEAGFHFVAVSPGSGNAAYGAGSDYELRIFNAEAGGGLVVVAVDVLNSALPPVGAVAVVDGVGTQAFGTATSVLTNLTPGPHTIEVPSVTGYWPLWDLSLPGEERNPSSYWYGNPKTVVVNPAEYQVAIFQFMPVIRANGVVHDGQTGGGVEGARLAFTARSGILSNAVFDGFPGQASYRTGWLTGPGGAFPTNVWLPAVDWDLTLSRSGFADVVAPGAILSAACGVETNAGAFALTPYLTANGTPQWWLMKYGWSNDFESVVTNDPDSDGRATWMEWVSDTDPTNPASALRILGLGRDTGGVRIAWCGGTSVSQYLERSQGLGSGAWWTAIFTNAPPTTPSTNTLDPNPTNRLFYYRIRTMR
jgi:hypothetical protein